MTRKNKKYSKKLTKWRKKQLMDIALVLAVMIGVGIIGFAGEQFKPAGDDLMQNKVELTHRLPINADKKNLTVQDKIAIAATRSGVDINVALRIADCESSFDEKVRNKQGSSATGVYQFIARTWFDYCEGDVKNADDNIACFMKMYPKHPSWWSCKGGVDLAKK
jgi:hypothetical protein